MPEATNVIVAAQGNVVIRMLSPIGSEEAPKLAGVVVYARNFFGRNQLGAIKMATVS